MRQALFAANAVVMLTALAWLASFLLPGRTVRARNAFLLRRGRDADFDWTPARLPPGFRAERGMPPTAIGDAVAADGIAGIAGDWPRALALTGFLVKHSKFEGGIRADLATTFAGIVAGRGYCADFVRVYLAASRSVDLFCRQWSFSFDGFGAHGHTFVEVFDRQRNAWSFIDVHNNVYAVVKGSQASLDALGLRSLLRREPHRIEFRQAAPGRLGWEHPEKLVAYYARGADEWYLWWGNDVVTRERRGLAGLVLHFSGRLAHWIASAVGARPPIVVLPTAGNERSIARMERLRSRMVAVASLTVVLAVALAVQVGMG